jgi:type IV pilus assembly protein PilW
MVHPLGPPHWSARRPPPPSPTSRAARPVLRGATRGLTLVELMVATTIGLLIIVTMGVLFAGNSRARQEIERAAQQVENGRLAIELLRDDTHQAGYYGGLLGVATQPMQTVSPCVPRVGVTLDATNLGWQTSPLRVPLPVHGYAAGDIPAADSCLSNQKPGSDVLILRNVESNPLSVAMATGSSYANDWFLQTSSCANPVVDSIATPFIVAAGGAGAAARFTLHEKDCTTPAVVRRLVVRAYYVGRCSVCPGAGDGIPSLRMVELSGSTATSAAIVEGVEAMRIEYTFDLAQTGQVDAIRRCEAGVDPCSVADWSRVTAIQVYLLARNLAPSPDHLDAKSYAMGLAGTLPPFNDRYKRRLYSALIVAHNLAGPRER